MTAADRFFRRPLFWAFAPFAAGAWIAAQRGPLWALFVPAAALLALASVDRSRTRSAAALALAALCAGAALPHASLRPRASEENTLIAHADGRLVHLGGVVSSEVETHPERFGRPSSSFVLDAQRLWPSPDAEPLRVRGLVRVHVVSPPVEWSYGDTGVFKGRLERLPPSRNPGGFDARAYWAPKGVHVSLSVAGLRSQERLGTGGGNPLVRGALSIRRACAAAFDASFRRGEAAVLKAMILGDKSGLDGPLKRLFVETGTMHVLVVSGANVAFVIALALLVTPGAVFPGRGRWALALAAVWSYGLLVGWQPPVMRACWMATALIAGRLTGRRIDPLNALGAAAILMTALHPADLRDAGFWLSFSCVFALAALYARLAGPSPGPGAGFAAKVRRKLSEFFWASFVCQIVTLPLVAHVFHVVPPYAVLTNLAAVPLAGLIFTGGAAYLALFGWWQAPGWIGAVFGSPIGILIRLLERVESLPGQLQVVGAPPAWAQALLAGGLAWILVTRRPIRPPVRAALAVLWAAAVLAGQAAVRDADRRFEITMLDVGQGDSIFLRFPDRTTMLVDAGGGAGIDEGERTVVPFLRHRGVRRLDWVILSHPQEDHAGGLESVARAYRPGRAAVAAAARARSRRYLQNLEEKGVPIAGWSAGDRVQWPGGLVETLSPGPVLREAEEPNDGSLVLRVEAEGVSALLTGDAGERVWERLLASDPARLDVDVLKVPHHGASLGSLALALARRTSPRVSLVSSGARNVYGHPRPETLAALAAVPDNRVLRTDRGGAATVTVRNGRLEARSWRSG